jgi:hypothetical protein
MWSSFRSIGGFESVVGRWCGFFTFSGGVGEEGVRRGSGENVEIRYGVGEEGVDRLRMSCRWNSEGTFRLGQVERREREREDGNGVWRLVVLMNLEFD